MLQEAMKNQMSVPYFAKPNTSPEPQTASTTLLGTANLFIDYCSNCELIEQYTQDSFLA